MNRRRHRRRTVYLSPDIPPLPPRSTGEDGQPFLFVAVVLAQRTGHVKIGHMLRQPSLVHPLATGDRLGPRAGEVRKGAPTRDVLLGGRAHDQRRPLARSVMKPAGLWSMPTRRGMMMMMMMMLGQLRRRRFGQDITIVRLKLNRPLEIGGPNRVYPTW